MKKIISVLLLMCFLLSSFAFAESATSQLQEMYAQAELLMATGDYAGAAAKFEAMGAYSDASQMAMYCKAVAAAETLGMYDVAIEAFKNLGDFKDSKQMATYYDGRKNQAAADYIIGEDITAVSDGDLETADYAYKLAADTFAGLALFKDCLSRMSDCQTKGKAIDAEQDAREATKRENRYQEALALEQEGKYEEAIKIYEELGDFKDCPARIIACNNGIKEIAYQRALALEHEGKYEDAIKIYKELGYYKDCRARIAACNDGIKEQTYQSALALEQEGKYQEAAKVFDSLEDYRDSKERADALYLALKQRMRIVAKHRKKYSCKDGKSTLFFGSDTVYKYETDGTYTETESLWYPDEGTKETITIKYDASKKAISGSRKGAWSKSQSLKYWKDSKYTFTSTIKFDDFNNPIEDKTTYKSPDNFLNANGSVRITTNSYTYDENGNVIKQDEQMNSNGKGFARSHSYEYEYEYDSNGRLIKKYEYQTYPYTQNNHLVERKKQDVNPSVTTYTYNRIGLIVESNTVPRTKSEPYTETIVTYEYEQFE